MVPKTKSAYVMASKALKSTQWMSNKIVSWNTKNSSSDIFNNGRKKMPSSSNNGREKKCLLPLMWWDRSREAPKQFNKHISYTITDSHTTITLFIMKDKEQYKQDEHVMCYGYGTCPLCVPNKAWFQKSWCYSLTDFTTKSCAIRLNQIIPTIKFRI